MTEAPVAASAIAGRSWAPSRSGTRLTEAPETKEAVASIW